MDNKKIIHFNYPELNNKEFKIKIKLYNNNKNKNNNNNKQINLENLLFKYKKKIELKKNKNSWDKIKIFTNKFELLTSSKFNNSITFYEPISRSYFKIWELIYDFNLITNKKQINICSLCEAPGGFLEAIINYRKKCYLGRFDNYYCMTLKSNKFNKEIPILNKYLIKKHKINIIYGKDNTGNIYKINNILYLKKIINDNKIDLVTADGGFDFSLNFDNQEQISFRLIFCQIICAISVNKLKGNFVLKIFDLFKNETLNLIYFLNTLYETVIITKPYTSRPANSEKYIICKNFLGISAKYLFKLYDIVKNWEIIQNNSFISQIFDIIPNKHFIKNITEYNNFIVIYQLQNIIKTLYYINNKPNKNKKEIILYEQIIYCLFWCYKYKQSVNYNNIFNI